MRHTARRNWMHLGLAAALLAAGCNGTPLAVAPTVASEDGSALFSVTIDADANVVAIGRTLSLALSGQSESGLAASVGAATWKSSDTKIATVSTSGVVTGMKKGRVTITATTKNPAREATLTLDVLAAGETASLDNTGGLSDDGDTAPWEDGPVAATPQPTAAPFPTAEGSPPPDGLMLAVYPLTNRVAVGETLRLIGYQGFPGNLSPAAAQWMSSDTDIASIDEAGVVTGRKAGAVRIRAASVAYPSLVTEIPLTVIQPATSTQIQGIRISPSKVKMNIGETFWLLAEVPTWSGGYDANIRWVSADTRVATVTSTGQITAIGPGKTSVTAVAATYSSGELSASVPVEVTNVSGMGTVNR